jgi:hypothetical protein
MTAELSIPRASAQARIRPGATWLRNGIVFGVMALILVLRAATSGPPIVIDPNSNVGVQTAQPNLPMTAAGIGLLAILVALDPAMAFVFIVCDMNGDAAYFDVDQWGVAHVFKFRDLEMALLLGVAVLGRLFSTKRDATTPLRRYLTRVAFIIPVLAFLYTLATLRFQSIASTVRYSRQLYVWLLLLAGPWFIRSSRDVRRVVSFLTCYVAVAAALFVAQSISPAQSVLRYSQQIITGGQVRIWSIAMSAIFIGGIAVFAHVLHAKKRRPLLWIVFALAALAIVMSQGRMTTALFAAAIGLMLVRRTIATGRVGLAVRVALTAFLVLGATALVLWSTNRLGPLVELWNERIDDIHTDVSIHKGSMTSRFEMLEYLPVIVHRNGGGVLALFFGMGLRTLTPADLAPLTFFGDISPPIWADNGLAGVMFTAGYFGMALLILFVVTILWRLRAHLRFASDPICRSTTITAIFYFLFALPQMFFSAHFLGTWDDALTIVVLLIVVERSAATLRWRRVAA